MGVFRTIVGIPVVPLFHTGEQRALGGAVTLHPIRDDHTQHKKTMP
jgi:hypothetical protein